MYFLNFHWLGIMSAGITRKLPSKTRENGNIKTSDSENGNGNLPSVLSASHRVTDNIIKTATAGLQLC
jgi:hypothetical protein